MKRPLLSWSELVATDDEPSADEQRRLLWADYLDERGDPQWAELIRLQIALSRRAVDSSPCPEWLDRVAELQMLLGERWQKHCKGLLAGPPQFHRGIPDTVAMEASVFLRRGAELFARLPVRRIRFLEPAACWHALWKCPLLARVQELDLCGADLAQLDLEPLFRSPYLRNLRLLDLSFNQLSDQSLAPLQRWCGFPCLRALILSDNRLSGQALSLLSASACSAHLEELDLSRNDITPQGIADLCSRPWPRLSWVRLSGNPLGDAGLALLVASPLFERQVQRHGILECRGHPQVRVTPAGLEVLLATPAANALTVIDLADQSLGDDGLATLLKNRSWSRLRRLILANNSITDRGILRLRHCWTDWLAQLSFLDLSGNRLTRFGIGLLTAALPSAGGAAIDTTANLQNLTPDRVADPRLADLHDLRQRIARPRRR